MAGIFSYPDPQKRDLAVRLVSSAGLTYDTAAKAWASAPAASLIPLVKVLAPNLTTYQVCELPDLPAGSPSVEAFVHPAADGPTVDQPIPLSEPAAPVSYGVAFFFPPGR